MRPRTLLLFAFVALMGAAAAVPALATASGATLEVSENCVELEWPCWTTEGSAFRPQPTKSVMIASGGTVTFIDHGKKANIAWTGTPTGTPPPCEPSVPVSPTPPTTPWEGKCTFATSGIYNFESSTLFKQAQSAYGNNIDYTKYEIVVAGTPTDATTLASGETQTEAMLNGSIDPKGNTVAYHFEYEGPGVTGGKQSTPAATLSATDFASHPVSAAVTGLLPNKTYHFELIATYGAGKTAVPGGEQTFITPAPAAPTATTTAATVKGQDEATLNGEVDPHGGNATEYFFEYGTSESYGEKTTTETGFPADNAEHPASATVHGLRPGTTYHFRLVAKNAVGGPINGVDRTFKTESLPAPKESPSLTTTTTTTPSSPPTTTTTTPIAALPPGPPIVGGPSLAGSQHGSSVRGSIEISKSGTGGRLEIDLISNSASLAKVRHKKSTSTVVGRLVRSSLYAGKVSFSVSLNAKAKRALSRHHRLALSVQIVLTPLHGAAVTITKSVVLHA